MEITNKTEEKNQNSFIELRAQIVVSSQNEFS